VTLTRALRPGTSWLAALLGSLAAAAVLAASASDEPQEFLDEDTAANVTIVGRPMVFSLSRIDLAANARDYATVSAASVNRGKKTDYLLLVYFWSTADPRMRPDPLPRAQPLVLQADDRRIALKPRGSAHDAGIGTSVNAPKGVTTAPDVYGTDLGTVRFLSQARSVTLLVEADAITLNYELWEDARPALKAFVRQMSGSI